MIEPIEIRGLWWLPDNEDRKIAGIVNYIPTESIKLELIGSFYDNDLAMFNSDRRQPIIWGESSDGKDITLIDCFSSLSWHSNCSFSLLKFSVCYVIIGKHIGSLKEAFITQATIQYDELSLWYCPDIIKYHLKKSHNDNLIWNDITNCNDDKFIMNATINDITLSLVPKSLFETKTSQPRIIVEQRTDLLIKADNRISLQDVLNINGRFEQFLSIATLSQVQCKKISLNEDDSKSSIELLHNFFRQNYSPNIKREYYLFRFSEIDTSFNDVLTEWFDKSDRIYPILSHFITSISQTKTFSSADFLTVVQALEGYYFRFIKSNEDLSNVLRYYSDEFKFIPNLNFDENEIAEIKDSRHYYTHLLPVGKKQNVVDGIELLKYFKRLRIHLLCIVLRLIGFDDKKIKTIIENCRNAILRQA